MRVRYFTGSFANCRHCVSCNNKHIFLLILFGVYTATTAACGVYDGVHGSECTEAFPTLFHIDETLGLTKLNSRLPRQVLIPSINFSCNGNISGWVFGASWQGLTPAYTEFQLWRRSCENCSNSYVKVSGTTIIVDGRNSSNVYEYALDPPLAFQEGDIFGYFQPRFNYTQFTLYLEDSNRIATHHERLSVSDLTTPSVGSTFFLDTADTDTQYPVIAVVTDVPGCGCGFISVDRVYSLLSSTSPHRSNNIDGGTLLLFPSVTFKCAGEIVRWTVAGRFEEGGELFTELHLWRQMNNSSTLFERLNNSVTVLSHSSDETVKSIHEFVPASPVVVQPGYILGIYVPDDSRDELEYDREGDTMFMLSKNNNKNQLNSDVFDIDGDKVRERSGSPLITVESPYRTTVPVSSSHQPSQHSSSHTTHTYLRLSTREISHTRHSPKSTITTSVAVSITEFQQHNTSGSLSVVMIGLSVAGGLIAIVIVALIFSVIVVVRRKKRSEIERRPVATGIIVNSEQSYIREDRDYVYAAQPTVCSVMDKNAAYNAHFFDDATTTWNDAYGLSSHRVSDGGVAENNYEKVVCESENVPVEQNVAYTATVQP